VLTVALVSKLKYRRCIAVNLALRQRFGGEERNRIKELIVNRKPCSISGIIDTVKPEENVHIGNSITSSCKHRK
jgi:hypothetical protein